MCIPMSIRSRKLISGFPNRNNPILHNPMTTKKHLLKVAIHGIWKKKKRKTCISNITVSWVRKKNSKKHSVASIDNLNKSSSMARRLHSFRLFCVHFKVGIFFMLTKIRHVFFFSVRNCVCPLIFIKPFKLFCCLQHMRNINDNTWMQRVMMSAKLESDFSEHIPLMAGSTMLDKASMSCNWELAHLTKCCSPRGLDLQFDS